jgi:hypothetical protein
MSTTTQTVQERLADVRRRLDELARRTNALSGEAGTRAQRRLSTLRQELTSIGSSARLAPDAVAERLDELESRVRVVASSLRAEAAADRKSFVEAVEDELHEWDSYLGRLQARAAGLVGGARKRAQEAVDELRTRRVALGDRLEEVRAASGGLWHERRQRLANTREELERKVDELSFRFKRGETDGS